MRILLVDDDATNARMLQALLTRAIRGPMELDVGRVGRLFEALQRLADPAVGVDAILLDLGLPECGGLTTLKLVRAQAPGIPVVVITGLDDPATAREAIGLGATDFLVKGKFDLERLERALLGVAARPAASTASDPAPPEPRGTFRRVEPGGPAASHLAGDRASG